MYMLHEMSYKALTADHTIFQSSVVDPSIIYGRMCSDSTPSIVYEVKMPGHSCDCGAYWSDLSLIYMYMYRAHCIHFERTGPIVYTLSVIFCVLCSVAF